VEVIFRVSEQLGIRIFGHVFWIRPLRKQIFQTIYYQANYHHMRFCHPFANFTEADSGKLNNIWLIGEIHLLSE